MSFSPYSIDESKPPEWSPGESQFASAFIGIIFFMVLEINVELSRAFKKRRGLYFWSMQIGTWGCAFDALGVLLKFLVPKSHHIWPLYTIFLLGGWSMYTTAQLLVLYSRLHLVCRSHKIQRCVLYMIIATVFILIVPSWIVSWPAYDIDAKISAAWSAPDAIVERYTQIGYTIVELILSGFYIWSIIKLLKIKSGVRERRVMLDLIYVNIIAVALDIVTVVLVYLNRTGLSHPVQTFSYILKLRLEFVVLNQLMAVAARGIRRETFEEKRYHYKSSQDKDLNSSINPTSSSPPPNTDKEKSFGSSGQHIESRQVNNKSNSSTDAIQLSVPTSALSNPDQRNNLKGPASKSEDIPSYEDNKLGSHSTLDQGATTRASSSPTSEQVLKRQQSPEKDAEKTRKLKNLQRIRPSKRNVEEDDDDEEIGLHMWENRGKVVLEVPWLRTKASV